MTTVASRVETFDLHMLDFTKEISDALHYNQAPHTLLYNILVIASGNN